MKSKTKQLEDRIKELEKIKEEDGKYIKFLILSCRQFAHLWISTFVPNHKLNTKIKGIPNHSELDEE